MNHFIRGLFDKPRFGKRLLWCFLAVVFMGFSVSWLKYVNWGTDPCSLMNFAISEKIGWSFGNWLALLNVCLFLIVIAKGRDKIGLGTILNMFLVGYSCDFMTWLREKLFPDLVISSLWVKILIMLVTLVIFVFTVAVYLAVDLGTAPYDAIPYILAEIGPGFSFTLVRICWDVLVTVIGIVVGGGLFAGNFGIVTVIMALTIGPCASFVGKRIQKYIS